MDGQWLAHWTTMLPFAWPYLPAYFVMEANHAHYSSISLARVASSLLLVLYKHAMVLRRSSQLGEMWVRAGHCNNSMAPACPFEPRGAQFG